MRRLCGRVSRLPGVRLLRPSVKSSGFLARLFERKPSIGQVHVNHVNVWGLSIVKDTAMSGHAFGYPIRPGDVLVRVREIGGVVQHRMSFVLETRWPGDPSDMVFFESRDLTQEEVQLVAKRLDGKQEPSR